MQPYARERQSDLLDIGQAAGGAAADNSSATPAINPQKSSPDAMQAPPTKGEKSIMSYKFIIKLATLGAVALCAGSSMAQQPNPRDAVPDNMPFSTPYGAPISLDHADAAIAAAVAEAKKHNWPMNIAVMDSGGNLVAFKRMDGAQLASVAIATHKAKAAVTFRRETKLFENGIQEGNLHYLLTLDGVIGSRGGIPLVEGGKMIGSIGCSGGTGSQDEVVCKAGAATINK